MKDFNDIILVSIVCVTLLIVVCMWRAERKAERVCDYMRVTANRIVEQGVTNGHSN